MVNRTTCSLMMVSDFSMRIVVQPFQRLPENHPWKQQLIWPSGWLLYHGFIHFLTVTPHSNAAPLGQANSITRHPSSSGLRTSPRRASDVQAKELVAVWKGIKLGATTVGCCLGVHGSSHPQWQLVVFEASVNRLKQCQRTFEVSGDH